MNRGGAILRTLLSGCGWLGIAHGAPSVALEVLGQITVHTELEPTAEGQNIVRGRLSDEVGKPVAGELMLLNARGLSIGTEPCPWLPQVGPDKDSDSPRNPKSVGVGADGEFCFITNGEKGLVLKAQATHFVEATHDIDLGFERALSRPRFVDAPQTIDLFEQTRHVVQILGRTEKNPPEGSRLSLSLVCHSELLISELPLDESRVQRFEFGAPQNIAPGNCQFVARASSPTRKPLQATRSVLVRDRVTLEVKERAYDAGIAVVTVSVQGSSAREGSALEEGLLEARDNGAFVALSPIKNGLAELELEMAHTDRSIGVSYVPASPAFLAGEPLTIVVPVRAPGFQWAGLHAVGLLVFTFWLGYAWLRPRRTRKGETTEPPKHALVQASGGRVGAVCGRVLDAHTGAPLDHAQLSLSKLSAERAEQIESVQSDASGAFEFQTRVESHALLRLEVTSPDYMTLTSTVKGAQVTVHLTERRRAVVSSLISWAQKAGRPWDRKPSATPGSVEATANQKRDNETADWARAVATAAYAENMPSEMTVESLRKPGGASPASTS